MACVKTNWILSYIPTDPRLIKSIPIIMQPCLRIEVLARESQVVLALSLIKFKPN